MAAEGNILLTCATASTVADQEEYSVPSDYLKMEAVFIDSTAHKLKLTPIKLTQRDSQESTGNPCYYYMWGINVSGMNSYYIGLNPIPQSSGSSDLHIFYRQQPQTMVAGGTAPEVWTPWQDYLVAYAAYESYLRRGPQWLPMAELQLAEWKEGIEKAKRFVNPLQIDWPTQFTDTGGYLGWYAE